MNVHKRVCLRRLTRCALGLALLLTRSAADFPKLGLIDFYGVRHVNREALVAAVPVKRGDPMPITFPGGTPPENVREQLGLAPAAPLPVNTRAIESAVLKVDGVRKAKAAVVCCESDRTATLFVGIQEEDDAPVFKYKEAPTGRERLTSETVALYDRFTEALQDAVRAGTAQEDDSEGHALFSTEPLKAVQHEFIARAEGERQSLQRVLTSSADAKHRAVAALVIGYSSDKRWAIRHLLSAVRDPDELVRNNAVRSIGAICALAIRRPDLRIKIPSALFTKMLSSLSWYDRNKATMVLLALTERRDPQVLRKLRADALPELVEMGRWKDSHSLMPLLLLGRIADLSDTEVTCLWQKGSREKVLQAVRTIR